MHLNYRPGSLIGASVSGTEWGLAKVWEASVSIGTAKTWERFPDGAAGAPDPGLLRYGKRDQADDTDFANPFFIAYGDVRYARMADAV